eukprot:10035-Heterococcus_DN1.PRE.2
MSRRRAREHGDLVARLQERIAEGDYYEALQLYKTSYARLWTQDKHDEAQELLVAGAVAMAKHKERNAATELGELLLDSLEEQHRAADEKTLGMLVSIADAFQPSIEQIIFLKRAVRFSANSQDAQAKSLRLSLAKSHQVLEELGSAARQYASAGAVDDYAVLLQQWSAKGYKSEADLFICRAHASTIVTYANCSHCVELCGIRAWRRPKEAAELWSKLQNNNSNGDTSAVVTSPLQQYTSLLLALIKCVPKPVSEECAQAFTLASDKFANVLKRDPELEQMNVKIGEKYFGIQPEAPMGGLLGSLMQMLG